MKKLFFPLVLLILVTVCNLESKEVVRHSQSFSKTIPDSTVLNIYVLFPDWQRDWYISETLPTRTKNSTFSRGTEFQYPEQVNLIFELGASGGDDDSLLTYIQPLVWDEADKGFAEIVSDTVYVIPGSARDYTGSTTTYFNWTAATEYHIPLIRWPQSSTTTNAFFWPTAGFVIHVRYVDASGGTPLYDLGISGVFEE